MLLAFLVSSIGLAYAEPDTTSSTNEGSTLPVLDERDLADLDDLGSNCDLDIDGGARLRPSEADTPDEETSFDEVEAAHAGVDDDVTFDRSAHTGIDDDVDAAHAGIDVAIDDDVDAAHAGIDVASFHDDVAHEDVMDGAGVDPDIHTPTWAHGEDTREAALRRNTSWLGRIDVSVLWRRTLNETTRRDEVWLVGTWRL
jgi:hypothetical protein